MIIGRKEVSEEENEKLKKEILETGRYARIEVIVPEDESLGIYSSIKFCDVSPAEVMALIDVMNLQQQSIFKDNPDLSTVWQLKSIIEL